MDLHRTLKFSFYTENEWAISISWDLVQAWEAYVHVYMELHEEHTDVYLAA